MLREERLEYWEPASKAETWVSERPDGGDKGEAEERPLTTRNIPCFCSGASSLSSIIWDQSCPLVFPFLNRFRGGYGTSECSLLCLGRAVKQTGFQITAEL